MTLLLAAIVGCLVVIALCALAWGGPWLVVWETKLGNRLMYPCWTRAGAKHKRDETTRLWGGDAWIERRNLNGETVWTERETR